MRLCLLFPLGLILTACGLSMNPDLPSTEEGGTPIFGGDGDDNISIGDGDPTGPNTEIPPAAGLGGANQTCLGPGGSGGMTNCEASR